jgi:hypothetical protein
VSWSGIPSPALGDWIALYRPGTPDGQYMVFGFTNGSAAGVMSLPIPSSVSPGTYEVRLLPANSGVAMATSNSFAVTACPTAALSSTPSAVALGGTVTATWSGVCYPTSTDWIAVHSVGASDGVYVAWIWSTGAAAGSAPIAIPTNVPAGSYELRMYANGSSTRLAVGNSFTVN